jgi:hypothetical protein
MPSTTVKIPEVVNSVFHPSSTLSSQGRGKQCLYSKVGLASNCRCRYLYCPCERGEVIEQVSEHKQALQSHGNLNTVVRDDESKEE